MQHDVDSQRTLLGAFMYTTVILEKAYLNATNGDSPSAHADAVWSGESQTLFLFGKWISELSKYQNCAWMSGTVC